MRVVIRVDASTVIGSGHVMRCLTLAERLRDERQAEVIFISRDLPGNMIALVRARGFAVAELPRVEVNPDLAGYAAWLTVSQEQDARDTLGVLAGVASPVDWLVVDSYALDERWEKLLRPQVGHIFVVDDLANRKHDCEVLLDQNFHLSKENRYAGLVPQACRLLVGVRYALLRKEFYAARRQLRERKGELRQILVFYGGSDRTDETSKAIRALLTLRPQLAAEFQAVVVVGKSNVRREAVRQLCDRAAWLEYHCQVDNVAELMAASDLMLSAGGTTTWERCYLGLPALVTAVADNQLQGCADCAEAGFQIYLGCASEVTEQTLIAAITRLTREQLQAQSEAGFKIMAGNDYTSGPYLTI